MGHAIFIIYDFVSLIVIGYKIVGHSVCAAGSQNFLLNKTYPKDAFPRRSKETAATKAHMNGSESLRSSSASREQREQVRTVPIKTTTTASKDYSSSTNKDYLSSTSKDYQSSTIKDYSSSTSRKSELDRQEEERLTQTRAKDYSASSTAGMKSGEKKSEKKSSDRKSFEDIEFEELEEMINKSEASNVMLGSAPPQESKGHFEAIKTMECKTTINGKTADEYSVTEKKILSDADVEKVLDSTEFRSSSRQSRDRSEKRLSDDEQQKERPRSLLKDLMATLETLRGEDRAKSTSRDSLKEGKSSSLSKSTAMDSITETRGSSSMRSEYKSTLESADWPLGGREGVNEPKVGVRFIPMTDPDCTPSRHATHSHGKMGPSSPSSARKGGDSRSATPTGRRSASSNKGGATEENSKRAPGSPSPKRKPLTSGTVASEAKKRQPVNKSPSRPTTPIKS